MEKGEVPENVGGGKNSMVSLGCAAPNPKNTTWQINGFIINYSHNPGSRKWLYLNCNYYWEKPIFHFNDYGRKGVIPLETSMEI